MYNKLGFKFHLEIPKYLSIENIIFEMAESSIPYQDDTYSVLNTREVACYFSNSTKTIKKANSASSES